jgi:hypothetical protein
MEYLLLAEYARLDAGLLTLAGGNFDNVVVPTIPGQLPIAIAGGVILDENGAEADIQLTIEGPPGTFKIVTTEQLDLSKKPDLDLGPRRAVFAGRLIVPLIDYGVYSIHAQSGSGGAKVVRFRVAPSASSPVEP